MTYTNYVKVTPAHETSGAKFIPFINAIIEEINLQINEYEDKFGSPFFSLRYNYESICNVAKKLDLPSSWNQALRMILHEVCTTFMYNGYDVQLCGHYGENGNDVVDYIEVGLPGRLVDRNAA